MAQWHIEGGVCTGALHPLGPDKVSSGIAKLPRRAPVFLSFGGFEGDAQGDRINHGGPDKAVHHYPLDHYAAWRAELGDHPLLDAPAAFGENIATQGLAETEVAIGDRFRLGNAIVQVSQGRQPCFRLNLRFGDPRLAKRVQQTGRSGWYYRVIEQGSVAPHDTLELLDRIDPQWTVGRLHHLLHIKTLNRDELHAVATLPHLPERWRRIARQRLETGVVEDWGPRLSGYREAGG